jgi:DNA repair exonuclease SbcCD ATPase subunit
VKSSVIDALKFATTNEKRKAVTENINDNKAKKKMSRFDEEDDSDSDS